MEIKNIKTRGSISGIIVIVIAIAIAVFAGYYWGAKKNGTILETLTDISQEFTATSTSSNIATTSKSSTDAENKTSTTKEVVAPKKPVGKLYTDPNGDFTFRYPENYVYEKEPLVPGEMGGYALRFYEKGSDWQNDPSKSFLITRRSIDTYQITIGVGIGCAYNTSTHSFHIASTLSTKTDCDNLSSKKNSQGTTYFPSFGGDSREVTFRESFISEKNDVAVTFEYLDTPYGSPSSQIQDLVIQSVLFK